MYGAESYASQSIDRVTQRVGLSVPRRHMARGKKEIYGHDILFFLLISKPHVVEVLLLLPTEIDDMISFRNTSNINK